MIGTAAKRVDTPEKATGRARFISDVIVPGMVHAKLWRSPVPHARIIAIDTSRARKAPCVIAVLTAKDLPVKDLYYGPAFKDQPLLADGVIRHAGEPVVAIVAETIAQADAALPLVAVEWHELPVVDSLDAALAPGAPMLHERARPAIHFRDLTSLKPIAGTNICHQYSYARGDLDRGFAEADLVVEQTLTIAMASHVRRPVRLALTVEEGFKTVRRAAVRYRLKTGVTRNGTLIARDC